MGGTPARIYRRPVRGYGNKWLSSFWAHQNRTKPSREPGVDYYCPYGTELVSIGDGIVSEIGGGVGPATGRYVKVNLFDGRSFRLLHLGPRHSLIPVGGRAYRGQPLAISGASGYGSEYFGASTPWDSQMMANTGGPHTHLTLFPTHNYNNFVGLLDPEIFMESEFLMALNDAEQVELLNAVRALFDGVYRGGASTPNGRPLAGLIGEIHAGTKPIERTVDGKVVLIPLRQEVADTKGGVLELLGREPGVVNVDVDEEALATALAAILGSASDAELARFATAAADEADRRARLRLGEPENTVDPTA